MQTSKTNKTNKKPRIYIMSQSNLYKGVPVNFDKDPNSRTAKTCDLDVSTLTSLNYVHADLAVKTSNTNASDADDMNEIRNPNINAVKAKLKAASLASPPIAFWSENPNVLFQQPYVLEFFPTEYMTYNQKLNAITRCVILLTLISYVFNQSSRLLAISAVTILAIFLLHFAHQSEKNQKHTSPFEGFQGEIKSGTNGTVGTGGVFVADPNVPPPGDYNHYTLPRTDFMPSGPDNPLGNVLLTDYEYNPNKKPAPPAFKEVVSNDILEKTKIDIAYQYPTQPDIDERLFKNLADEFEFEQSMRPFYSTASTTIPNDQAAFANFCYGEMISCKEGDENACNKTFPRYQQ